MVAAVCPSPAPERRIGDYDREQAGRPRPIEAARQGEIGDQQREDFRVDSPLSAKLPPRGERVQRVRRATDPGLAKASGPASVSGKPTRAICP